MLSATGIEWLLAGACLTALPLRLAGIFARAVMTMTFTDVSDLIAGSTTHPTALADATGAAGSEAPTVASATVNPLTRLPRIDCCAQVLTLTLVD